MPGVRVRIQIMFTHPRQENAQVSRPRFLCRAFFAIKPCENEIVSLNRPFRSSFFGAEELLTRSGIVQLEYRADPHFLETCISGRCVETLFAYTNGGMLAFVA